MVTCQSRNSTGVTYNVNDGAIEPERSMLEPEQLKQVSIEVASKIKKFILNFCSLVRLFKTQTWKETIISVTSTLCASSSIRFSSYGINHHVEMLMRSHPVSIVVIYVSKC